MAFPKTVTVSWTDPNPAGSVTEYRISRNQEPVAVVTASPYTDVIDKPGTYEYGIVAASADEVAEPGTGVFVALAALLPVHTVTFSVG